MLAKTLRSCLEQIKADYFIKVKNTKLDTVLFSLTFRLLSFPIDMGPGKINEKQKSNGCKFEFLRVFQTKNQYLFIPFLFPFVCIYCLKL